MSDTIDILIKTQGDLTEVISGVRNRSIYHLLNEEGEPFRVFRPTREDEQNETALTIPEFRSQFDDLLRDDFKARVYVRDENNHVFGCFKKYYPKTDDTPLFP